LIVIGADSKLSQIGLGKPDEPPICKIFQFDGVFFAPGKLVRESRTGLDVVAIAGRAAQGETGFTEKATAFEQLVLPELYKAVKVIRTEHQDCYLKFVQGRSVLQAIWAEFDGSAPALCKSYCLVSRAGEGFEITAQRQGWEPQDNARYIEVVFAGQ